MKQIQLTKGYVAVVDDEDFERVISAGPWQVRIPREHEHVFYARRYVKNSEGKNSTQFLHRFILDLTKDDPDVDHKDHDGLNCQKENLRIVTGTQNQGNTRKLKISSSQYKGVYWSKDRNKWRANIYMNGKQNSLGYFLSEKDAAIAYDSAAINYFGKDFALTNFMAE